MISILHDYNLRQSAVIYSNLPVLVTLLSTTIICAITVKKGGERSTYIDLKLHSCKVSALYIFKYS